MMTANTAFARPAFNPAIKSIITKYGLTMFGIAAFSILLFIGLSLYNRFFVVPRIKDANLNEDSLRTPADKEDAILSFITRNRLR